MAVLSTGFAIFDLALLILGAFLAIFVYFKNSYRYWKNKGVPYLEPKFPLGNSVYLLPKFMVIAGESKHWYEELKARGHKFGGVWAFSRKILVIVDPEYIKDILTKDFQYFMDRDVYSDEINDPLSTHLFNVKNLTWKPLRQKLTPSFTSGKMKMMFNNLLSCTEPMIQFLDKSVKTGDDINIKEVLASFTTDVIGSVAFGIECNSFDDSHAEFRKQGIILFKPTWQLLVKALMLKTFPDLSRKLKIKGGKKHSRQFFYNVVKQTMEHRKKNNIKRPDFLQLLIDLYDQDGDKSITFEQIVANTMLFFIAGFDTSSSTMTYVLYHLARNPDAQEKVREEINRIMEKHRGQITYDALQEMTYLRQCIDESMRIYPPVLTLPRLCTKDYQLRDTNIIIEKGTPVAISVLGLGRDPEYFPDPERFDPERFSAEAKANRHPHIHLPFGEGPRNCIGLRFGIMQSKIGLIAILSKFRLSLSPKTKLPVSIDLSSFLLTEISPVYLNAKKL